MAGKARYRFVAVTALVGSGLAVALLAQPLVIPGLRPTAYPCFERPHAPVASLRNASIGHGVAILAGYAALPPRNQDQP